MPLLPPVLSFPEPGQYVRYWDTVKKQVMYERLVERQLPLVYPRRLGNVAPGSTTSIFSFSELNPSKEKKHRYYAFIGVQPGALYRLYHPYSVRVLRWDENVTLITEALTGTLEYEDSPYDAPAVGIWIVRDQYPAVDALNTSWQTHNPSVKWVAARYLVKGNDELPSDVLQALDTGALPAIPVNAGGEL